MISNNLRQDKRQSQQQQIHQLHQDSYFEYKMQQLLKQNEQLQDKAQKYYKQIMQLQSITSQHQNEIQTLLKFNQKLLGIIEKQLNGQKKLKNSDILSLQPISQKTQIQSEMFQSQFSNVGTKLLMKNSLNIHVKPQAYHDRVQKRDPLAGVEKEEILSIDVEGQDKDEEGHSQVHNLIVQFRKGIKVGNEFLSVSEIQKKWKEDSENLSKIKKQSQEASNNILQKLSNLNNEIVRVQAKDKLVEMLEKVEGQQSSKNILTAYLSAL